MKRNSWYASFAYVSPTEKNLRVGLSPTGKLSDSPTSGNKHSGLGYPPRFTDGVNSPISRRGNAADPCCNGR